jgi:uncharacterized protein YcfJ
MTRKNMIFLGIGVVVLMLITAGASAYIANMNEPGQKAEAVKSQKITWNEQRQQPQPQKQAAVRTCDDSNIVGTALGAVAGGVIGNQIGSGKGQDVATIGGADARSEGDAPEIDGKVYLRDAGHLKQGDIVKVKVEDADDYDLYGVPASA